MVLRKCLHHTVQLALSFEGLRQLAQVYLSLSVSGIVRPLNEPRAEQDPYYIRQYKDNKDPPPPPPQELISRRPEEETLTWHGYQHGASFPDASKDLKAKVPPPPSPEGT